MHFDMNATMPYVHYSNPHWNKEQTVWGQKVNGLHYDYSDRLFQWDYKKADESFKKATEEHGPKLTPKKIQTYLSLYHDKPVEIKHILAGVNQSSGYPYWCYGYKVQNDETKNQ